MKLLFSLLTLLMLNKECNSQKTADMTSDRKETSKVSEQEIDVRTIWYEAMTRGFYQKITITETKTMVSSDVNQKDVTTYDTKKSDWDALMLLLNELAIEELPKLEAPTSKRFYDGAAIATLAIATPEKEIKSNSFDHGEPPKEIEALVNKMISIKENLEKE